MSEPKNIIRRNAPIILLYTALFSGNTLHIICTHNLFVIFPLKEKNSFYLTLRKRLEKSKN